MYRRSMYPMPGLASSCPYAWAKPYATLALRPHSILSADFKLLVQDRPGPAHQIPAPPTRLVRGEVRSSPGNGHRLCARRTEYR